VRERAAHARVERSAFRAGCGARAALLLVGQPQDPLEVEAVAAALPLRERRVGERPHARWRRGGLALRVGGWCLGASTVSGITLWRTVFLHDRVGLPVHLLLHELAHVHQFRRVRGFPARYCWESVARGYRRNRFEREADAYADRIVAERAGPATHVAARADAAAGRSP